MNSVSLGTSKTRVPWVMFVTKSTFTCMKCLYERRLYRFTPYHIGPVRSSARHALSVYFGQVRQLKWFLADLHAIWFPVFRSFYVNSHCVVCTYFPLHEVIAATWHVLDATTSVFHLHFVTEEVTHWQQCRK